MKSPVGLLLSLSAIIRHHKTNKIRLEQVMAKDYTRNTIVRQWELLKLLPSAGSGKTIKEMTSTLVGIGFPIGERQVERP